MTDTPDHMLTHVELYTDGACLGNPGPGGWGALLRYGTVEKELSGGVTLTTNNRMEMTAAIRGLQALTRPCRVTLVTDSIYVKDGVEKYLAVWKRNGWKNASKKPVKNQDLWQELDTAMQPHKITWQWVKGHSGHAENERVDVLARDEAEKLRATKEVF